MLCTFQKRKVLYFSLQRERVWSREGARGEDALQRRGMMQRGCSIGRTQPGGAAGGGQTLFASPAFKCGPRSQFSQQVAWLHPCKSKCTIYGTAHGFVASFLIPFVIEINQQKHKQIVVHLPSRIQLFATPWTTVRPAPPSLTVSQRLLRFLAFVSVMLSNHLELCLPPSPFTFSLSEHQSFPMSRLFAVIKWLKFWSFSISPSSE